MTSFRTLVMTCAALAACGGGARGRTTTPNEIRLQPTIAEQRWFRSIATCAQGPFELELSTEGVKWGESVELRVHAPHRVALHAVMLVDDGEVARTDGVFEGRERTDGRADNTRCVADARERLQLGRVGAGGGEGAPLPPGTPVPEGSIPSAPPPSAPAQLQLEATFDPAFVTRSAEVLQFRLPEGWRPGARIKIRFWSIEPNDLAGVVFGVARVTWRPNVSEAEYEAYLVAEQRRREEEERRRREEARQRQAKWLLERENAPRPSAVELAAERARREKEWRRAEEERARREQEERRRAEAARLRREEEERRRAIAAALEAERKARRAEYCARHPEDRDCWGAGGLKVHLELEARARDRERYCAAHAEDARCWSSDEWSRRRAAYRQRVELALAPPKQPDGPPPAPLVEIVPPKLSKNAEWRPGYWHWIDGTWIWLAGMWRVPESDILAEETTTAPVAPPPPQEEQPPPPPVAAAVWIAGFWQWDGRTWVWVPGSWQLRPQARVQWRAPEWRARGGVHVLIPGGWIRIGGGR